jgi:hypothetical protein
MDTTINKGRAHLLILWLLAGLAAAIGLSSADSTQSWSKRLSVSFQMGEADSRLTALEGARDKLREAALNESGAYVESRQVLSGDDFSETLRLLRSAYVSISEENVRVRTDPKTQVSTLHLDALVSVDTGVLKERVAALADDESYRMQVNRLSAEERRIVDSLDRLNTRLKAGGIDGSLFSGFKEWLVEAKERTRAEVSRLATATKPSLLDRAREGSAVLELGKLVALEHYYLNVIAPYSADLEVEATIVSAAPSTSEAGKTEVVVDLEIFYDPEPPVMMAMADLSYELDRVVAGKLWLPTNPQQRLADLKLASYERWVEETLLNMPLLAVVTLGEHKAYYPVLGNPRSVGVSDSYGHKLNYIPETRLHSTFNFPFAFTAKGYSEHRTIKRTYRFQIPNAQAALISDVEAGLKLIQITP